MFGYSKILAKLDISKMQGINMRMYYIFIYFYSCFQKITSYRQIVE